LPPLPPAWAVPAVVEIKLPFCMNSKSFRVMEMLPPFTEADSAVT
jgi:hypothetical protein